jgi:cell division septation protein DedD
VNDDTAAIAGTAANGELAITPDAAVDDLSSPPAAAAPQPPAQEPQQVAAAPATETPPAEVARSTSSGGALVQVSSQRSEDAALATFRDLQARYPSILGQYQPDVQRADIPDRGTFFRVRVGPFSAGDAQRLCNDLKAAGGDCIIAQR